jgi:predicted nucleotidyltransferase
MSPHDSPTGINQIKSTTISSEIVDNSRFRLKSGEPVIDSIQDRLDAIAQERDIKILFACESGSRVWGFFSKNSDYDVRYIYARPPEDYISLINKKDEIRSAPDPVYDIVGWDVQKALRLLAKSNPNLGEWLNTDHLYSADSILHSKLKDCYNQSFSPKTLNQHYISMAKGVWFERLQGPEVSAKGYLYGARAVLASEWLVSHQTFPALSFDTLLESSAAPSLVKNELAGLVATKRAGEEKGLVARNEVLDDFLLKRIANPHLSDSNWIRLPGSIQLEHLNEVFKDILFSAYKK